ncbi:MAG: single-stranded-DNA-specific exonuclease RecJ [Limnothrix sp.]
MNWQLCENDALPDVFVERVRALTHGTGDRHLAQLLWQRHFNDLDKLAGFLDPDAYTPISAFAFGQEMKWAMSRLVQARNTQEKIAIWGDFDADGVTATSVLWEGLGQFFEQEQQLIYYVPNRLTESHGLNCEGLDRLKGLGINLVVTCDTGSTNLREIAYAKTLNLEIIVTDHHTLPGDRPEVVSMINPRYFAETHPLYNLSGVAVAYKLIEALYETLPDVPTQPVTNLLDLVAIGLIADLVALKGDCRYLAQMGIRELQKQLDPKTVVHPGIKFLLEACRKTGDRPTDISFGIGPRINAVSRIHGDASFCVELLTSRELHHCRQLAQQAELANTRRKEIQNTVVQQAKRQAEKFDLSTTGVLILADPQWQGGVLGLVANQVAQEFGRPTIMLTYDRDQDLWKGSARSAQGIDLYELVHSQQHLLHRFGGHPFAAGLSLKPENLELFQIGINQKARRFVEDQGQNGTPLTIDLAVDISDLGKALFQELKCLEPCGMGNPVPKILVRNCTLEVKRFHKLRDKFNRKLNYYKTDFLIWDETGEIDGIWWGGHPDDLLQGDGIDIVLELDYSSVTREYFVRLLDCRRATYTTENTAAELPSANSSQTLIDYRSTKNPEIETNQVLIQSNCPVQWQDLYPNYQQAVEHKKYLALAYSNQLTLNSDQTLKILIGTAKYLVAAKKTITTETLKEKLSCGDRRLILALQSLVNFGFAYEIEANNIIFYSVEQQAFPEKIEQLKQLIAEENFQQQYFMNVPLVVMEKTLGSAVQVSELA